MMNMISAVLENIVIFRLELQMNQDLQSQFNVAACQSLKKQMTQKVSVAILDI